MNKAQILKLAGIAVACIAALFIFQVALKPYADKLSEKLSEKKPFDPIKSRN